MLVVLEYVTIVLISYFLFKQKTAYEMRISDWSSDVCSSDLEVITDLVRNEIQSYKQLPANFYQIQTKFRDEVRPRFGIMRAREFLMKDAYSFHLNAESLEETYQIMHRAYCAIFKDRKSTRLNSSH